jgi:hypothetical protein
VPVRQPRSSLLPLRSFSGNWAARAAGALLALVLMLHPLLVSPASAAQSRVSARKAGDTADAGLAAAVACLGTGRFVPVPTPQGTDRSGSRLYLCKDSSGLLSPQDPPYPVIACTGPMACSPTGESKGR